MRIAIVAPSPNPFVFGGAENLLWGLVEHLRDETGHVPELIKLPVRETTYSSPVSVRYVRDSMFRNDRLVRVAGSLANERIEPPLPTT